MKTGDGAAGDGDEAKGKQLAGNHRPGPINEPAERGHLQMRQEQENAADEREDGAESFMNVLK